MTPQPPPDDPLPERPLDTPEPGERRVMKWVGALLGTSVLSAFWLAARAESPPGVREALDAILELGLAGLFLGGAYRLLAYYPYRLLDLLTMVLVLSVGLKVTLDTLQGLQYFMEKERALTGLQFGRVALSCTLTSSVLLCGAALGLRYCTRLKLDRARQRVAAILYGMTAVPAAVGLFAFPVAVLVSMVNPTDQDEPTLLYLALFIASFLVTARNGVLLFRSMALEDEVSVNRERE